MGLDREQSGDRSARPTPPLLRSSVDSLFSSNERLLLDLIRTGGALSRADLARQTGLTVQSVVRLVDGLVARGFLTPGARIQHAGPGQPGLSIQPVPDAAFTLGVSIMTDAVSLVLTDWMGHVRADIVTATDVADRVATMQLLKSHLATLAQRAEIDRHRIIGIGVAITGYFVGPGRINAPAGLGSWALIDLQAELSDAFNLPVWLENDGTAAAVGESLYGVGRRHRSFAYLYVGAGLGGGVVLDGRPWRGRNGNGGEFTGLLAPVDRPTRPTLSLLREILAERGHSTPSISAMLRDFDPAWPGVETWLERTRPALTALCSAIAAVLDPEVIVIGGRLPPSLALLLAERASFHAEFLRDHERPFPPVIAAEVPGDAAALGAASLPLKQYLL